MASITTVPDKATGDIFTESMWDSSIRDNINNGIVTQLGCRVFSSANVATTSTPAAISFNSERFDNDTMHSSSTDPTRITINTDGVYVIGGNVEWQGDSGRLQVNIKLNGSDFVGGQYQLGLSGSVVTRMVVTTMYNCVAGDYFELFVASQNSVMINNTAFHSPEFWACRL